MMKYLIIFDTTIYYTMKIRNKYKIWATRWGIGLTAIGLFMILYPAMSDMKGMDMARGLLFGGSIILLLMTIIIVLILMKKARRFNHLTKSQNIITQFTVPAYLLKEYVEYFLNKYKYIEGFRILFWVFSIFFLFLGIIMIIYGADFSIISLITLGLIALTYIVCRIVIISAKNKKNTIKGDVIIAREGGIFDETLYYWSQKDYYFKNIEIEKVSKTLQVLEVTYATKRFYYLYGTDFTRIARFPFPAEMIEEIKRVVEILSNQQFSRTN